MGKQKVENEQIKIYQSVFKIVSINVNSIVSLSRRHDLGLFLKERCPDIAALSETKVYPEHNLKFDGYQIFRNDRLNNKGGGSALLIKNTIKCTAVFATKKLKLLECTIVKINLNSEKKLFIISAYASGTVKGDIADELSTLFETLKLDEDKHYYILVGDLNARHRMWKNPINNQRGCALYNWFNINNLKFKTTIMHTKKPSFLRADSYIDIALVDSRLVFYDEFLENFDYDSDHTAVGMLLNLGERICLDTDPNSEQPYLYKKTNWKKFQKRLDKNFEKVIPKNRNLNNNEIDLFIEELQVAIEKTIKETTPKLKPINNTGKLVNHKIESLYKKKHKIQTQIHKYKSNNNIWAKEIITDLKRQMKEIKQKIYEEFNLASNKNWYSLIASIDYRDSASFFPSMNKIFRKKGNSTISEIFIKKEQKDIMDQCSIDVSAVSAAENGYVLSNPEEIPNVIGSYFEKINTADAPVNSPFERIVFKQVADLKQRFEEIGPVLTFSEENNSLNPNSQQKDIIFTNVLEIKKILKKMSNKTSSGWDGIPNVILKNISQKFIENYTIIINNIINNLYYPNVWKIAKLIVLIKKKSNSIELDNLRPISLLPVISKILERIIKKSINQFCKINKIIPDEQFGFKEGHSTIHAINKFISDINWHLNNGEMVGATLIDLRKAFDSLA